MTTKIHIATEMDLVAAFVDFASLSLENTPQLFFTLASSETEGAFLEDALVGYTIRLEIN